MKKRVLFIAGAASWMTATIVMAQVVTTGTLVVVAEGQDGSRLPGAVVTVSAPDTTTRRTAVANAQGEVTLPNLDPSALYVVQTEMPGFQQVKNERVLVRSGQTTTLRITLGVASATEQLTVIAETPLVDTTS